MNLIILLRILVKNRYLIVAGGLLMGATIYFLTRNSPKIYDSSTIIYTGIATGFNIESGANQKYDLFGTNAKFDNLINLIKSRETQEEALIRLLAVHMIADETGQDRWGHLDELIPDSIRKKLVDVYSVENTVKNIWNFSNTGESNEIYTLLHSDHDFYGLEKIAKTSIRRIQNSDLISLEYSGTHARIVQQSLEKLTEVFLRKYTGLQSGQTHTVVGYFEERVKESHERLNEAEDDLLTFKKKHHIINYYEQTKFIADQKEKLDKDYQEQIMSLAASKAALAELESRVSIKTSISLQSDKILDKRKRLSDLSSKIAMAQVYNKGSSSQMDEWNQEAEMLKIGLREDVEKLDTYGKSTTGIPLKELLKHWLENAVLVEEAEARAVVIEGQKKDFDEKYKTFAPIGSELSKIEREIEIAEKEYLNNLHSLNQSKLKQQNIELSSNIRVLDQPVFPLKPRSSMTKILWIVGFIIGMVLVSAAIILLEFLDSTIKTPDRAKDFTKLSLLGVFPKVPKDSNSSIDFQFVSNRLIEIIIQRIKLASIKSGREESGPFQINFSSTRDSEGKEYLASLLAEKLRMAGNKVLIFQPYINSNEDGNSGMRKSKIIRSLKSRVENISQSKLFPGVKADPKDTEGVQRIDCIDKYAYEVNNDFFDLQSFGDLMQVDELPVDEYDYVFVLLPSLLNKEFPASLVMQADYSVFVCRANRVWSRADTESLTMFTNTVTHQPTVLLNGSRLDYLDTMIGEIPKQRSKKRRLAKRIITFDFWSDEVI